MTLEQLFERSLRHDSYDKGSCDLTTTQILSPPQTTHLALSGQPSEESSYKNFMSMIGSGIHKVLEDAAYDHEIAEHRFYCSWDFPGRKNPARTHTPLITDVWTLGGMMDFGSKGRTDDYKITTTDSYEITGGKIKDEHYWQGQINAWLANHDEGDMLNGDHITKGAVLYIFRDWSYSKAKHGRHPAKPYVYHEFDILPADEIEIRIKRLMTEHIDAILGNPRPCTQEERWQKPDQWAVIKFGASRALKVFDRESEAMERLAEVNKKKSAYVIEHRKGTCTRCESWCWGTACPQYRGILKGL